jgi:hypothetical protein
LLGQPYSCTDFWFRNRGAKLQECPDKFVQISEDEYAVKEISQKLINNKKPSLTGFPLVGFSRVEVRPKIFVSIFSEFYIMLIFYFYVENDV